MAQRLKRLPGMWETRVRSLGREDPLEKKMATHSSILAWRIPWREEPGRLLVHGVAKSRTQLSNFTFTFTFLPSHFSFLSTNTQYLLCIISKLSRWYCGKESTCQWRRCKTCGFHLWVKKIPWRRKWQPTPVFLPGESHGERNLVGYSP